jgi:hypothetical protein
MESLQHPVIDNYRRNGLVLLPVIGGTPDVPSPLDTNSKIKIQQKNHKSRKTERNNFLAGERTPCSMR